MIDPTPHDPDAMPLSLDVLLSDILPEIKLALGELIDRENARALPGRYARLLPETQLVVTLRPDAAEAITPIAADLEQELTDSCSRHGSLYDRVYGVQLRRSEDRDAPLFTVAAHAGQDLAASADDLRESEGTPAPPSASVAPGTPGTASAPHAPLPLSDPDATRAEGMEAVVDWDSARWVLVVEDEHGEEQEVFRLGEPFSTVGRRSDDPRMRVTVALRDVPHVSRRQLALLWDGEHPQPGFRVFNLGLNPLHVAERAIPGARVGRDTLNVEAIDSAHSARVGVDTPVRIGDHGPVLRIREVPAPAEDPDATQFG